MSDVSIILEPLRCQTALSRRDQSLFRSITFSLTVCTTDDYRFGFKNKHSTTLDCFVLKRKLTRDGRTAAVCLFAESVSGIRWRYSFVFV